MCNDRSHVCSLACLLVRGAACRAGRHAEVMDADLVAELETAEDPVDRPALSRTGQFHDERDDRRVRGRGEPPDPTDVAVQYLADVAPEGDEGLGHVLAGDTFGPEA